MRHEKSRGPSFEPWGTPLSKNKRIHPISLVENVTIMRPEKSSGPSFDPRGTPWSITYSIYLEI